VLAELLSWAGPRPRDLELLLLDGVEARRFGGRREGPLLGETKGSRRVSFGNRRRRWEIAKEDPHGGVHEGLIRRSPSYEGCAALGAQNTADLGERPLPLAKHMTPRRQVTLSKLASPKGSSCTSA
jgi:hypothetical protein